MTACIGGIRPVVIQRPGEKGVGPGIFPKDGVGAIDGGSSNDLPTGVKAVVDRSTVIFSDRNGVAAVDGDGIESSG